jgi:nicotinamide-nucleotide adenylyltransferase
MKRRLEKGLFIARFQPFHKGHLYALKYSAKRCRHLVIGIGSSNVRGTERNPLGVESRIKILRAVLKKNAPMLKNVSLVKIPDFNDNVKWFEYINRKIPKVDVVFSRSPIVLRIFKQHGFLTVLPPWHQRERLSASKIRKLIREGRHWEDRVPRTIVKEIALKKDVIEKAFE